MKNDKKEIPFEAILSYENIIDLKQHSGFIPLHKKENFLKSLEKIPTLKIKQMRPEREALFKLDFSKINPAITKLKSV